MTEAEAIEIQVALAPRVRIVGGPRRARLIAGAVARAEGPQVVAAAVVLSLPDLAEVASAVTCQAPEMPYRSAFRAFYDGPALLAAIRALAPAPDVVLLHGHGVAHPRGIGLASHLGVLLDLPTIGCADSPLTGDYEEPGPRRGDRSPIMSDEPEGPRVVGAAVRTRAGVRPLLVSPGHRISLDRAVESIITCSRYRWPEPLRAARARLRAAE